MPCQEKSHESTVEVCACFPLALTPWAVKPELFNVSVTLNFNVSVTLNFAST